MVSTVLGFWGDEWLVILRTDKLVEFLGINLVQMVKKKPFFYKKLLNHLHQIEAQKLDQLA